MTTEGPAHADPPAHAPGAGETGTPEERRAAKERLMEEALEQMRALRVWRITEELKLDEATAAKLFPLLASYDDQIKPLGHERHQIHRALREIVDKPHADVARVEQLVAELLQNRAKMLRLEDERIAATRKVLTPLQQAKLLLILPMIEEGFRRRIREAMGKGRSDRRRGGDREGAAGGGHGHGHGHSEGNGNGSDRHGGRVGDGQTRPGGGGPARGF